MRWKSQSTQIKRIRSLERTVRELTREEIENKKTLPRLLGRNFLLGVARGVGSIIGVALLGMISVYLLSRLSENEMAGIGKFIAEFVKWVQRQL